MARVSCNRDIRDLVSPSWLPPKSEISERASVKEPFDPSYINTTNVKGSQAKSMPNLDQINSKLELCMRIITNTLECPTCSEKAKLEIENYNNNINNECTLAGDPSRPFAIGDPMRGKGKGRGAC
jgi:hypothetical protein